MKMDKNLHPRSRPLRPTLPETVNFMLKNRGLEPMTYEEFQVLQIAIEKVQAQHLTSCEKILKDLEEKVALLSADEIIKISI